MSKAHLCQVIFHFSSQPINVQRETCAYLKLQVTAYFSNMLLNFSLSKSYMIQGGQRPGAPTPVKASQKKKMAAHRNHFMSHKTQNGSTKY